MTLDFTVKGDYIELIGLLKALNLASSGGEAKMLVDDGIVYLNGTQEFRRRAKVKPGDKVELQTDDEKFIIQIK
ncbi:MAG: RNA-binding S4 domain-containing protein [Prevotellaceae bacterium]|nr:RNA-binding S4 domain-containing protein [Prevotellaceae bacterium]